MKLQHILILFISGTLLTSCHIFGNYERPTEVDSLLQTIKYRDVVVQDDSLNFGTTPWRQVFTDPTLQNLITRVLEQNADMRSADLNLQKAEVGLKLSKYQFFLPTISFSPSGTISKVFDMGAENSKTYNFPVSASWQADAFGKLRNNKKQVEMQLYEVKESHHAIQTSLICTTAQLYYGLQVLDQQLAITESTLQLWDKNIQTLEAMKTAGMVNQAAVSSAKAQYIQIQATLPTLRNSATQMENSICLLLHESPHAIERTAFNPASFNVDLDTGIPFYLLGQRPDVRIAELELARCFYAKLGARSAFYPSLSITGNGAFTNSLGSAVVNPGKFIASGIASLVQPIVQRGQLIGQLKVSKLAEQQAELAFEKSLISAATEVSNDVASYRSYEQQLALTRQQVAELERANEATHELFLHAGGTTTYLETLTAQMSLLQGQLTLINDQYQMMLSGINLYQALGGGPEETLPQPLP